MMSFFSAGTTLNPIPRPPPSVSLLPPPPPPPSSRCVLLLSRWNVRYFVGMVLALLLVFCSLVSGETHTELQFVRLGLGLKKVVRVSRRCGGVTVMTEGHDRLSCVHRVWGDVHFVPRGAKVDVRCRTQHREASRMRVGSHPVASGSGRKGT